MGGFYADNKSSSIYGSELIEFHNIADLCFIDKSMLSSDTLTYASQSHHHTIITIVLQLEQIYPLFLKCIINYFVCSDHRDEM